MDSIVHGITKSRTRLSNFHFTSLQWAVHSTYPLSQEQKHGVGNVPGKNECSHLAHVEGACWGDMAKYEESKIIKG